MNLESKHLAPYLPYGLKIESQYGNGDMDYKGLKKEMTLFNLHQIDGDKWKPLLRPLSASITEIEIDGKKFIPIDYNAFKTDKEHLVEFINGFAHYKSVKYGIMERLIEWHFDVFGLIGQGLALPLI